MINKNKKTKGYITLVVVILLVPFLLLQGINLIHISIDIVNVAKNSVNYNSQYIQEQSCWEEVLYFFRKNDQIIGEVELQIPEITCRFSIENLGGNKYKISLETEKNNYYSFSERYIFYDIESIKYIASQ